jgi:hypothetical protein
MQLSRHHNAFLGLLSGRVCRSFAASWIRRIRETLHQAAKYGARRHRHNKPDNQLYQPAKHI